MHFIAPTLRLSWRSPATKALRSAVWVPGCLDVQMVESPTRRLTLTTCDDASTVPSRWRLCEIAPLRTKPASPGNGLIPPLRSQPCNCAIPMSSSARLIGLLNNSRFIFIVAMVAGLALSGGASQTEHALVPVLALIMTVSILDVSSRIFTDFRRALRPVAVALVLNFVLLSGTYIGLSYLLINDLDLHRGFVLIAAVPAAVAVVPLTLLLGGNTGFSLLGNVALYVAALVITPLISLVFLGADYIDPARLLIILGELIVVPIVLSRILRRTPLMASVDKWREPVVNWGFFLVIYTIFGLNRDIFFEEPSVLLPTAAVSFVAIFVLAEVVDYVSRRIGVRAADRISLMLLATRKNGGAAAAIALVFFDPRAALPVAVMTAISVLHFIWMTWRVKWMH